MTNIRPDADEIIKILNNKTSKNWSNTKDNLDELEFTSGNYVFKIIYKERYNGKWIFKVLNLRKSETEAQWKDGVFYNKKTNRK